MGIFSKKSASGASGANGEEPLESYTVIYKGGHPDYPKSKSGGIKFNMFSDRFELKPTMGSKWFSDLTIPYKDIKDVKIVGRQVGTAESILGGLNSRQLNQDNNINISCALAGRNIILRLEMLTGVTVMGQAKKCREFEDRLTTNGIRRLFSVQQPTQSGNIVEQLKSLESLRAQGTLTEEEFQKAKNHLLK